MNVAQFAESVDGYCVAVGANAGVKEHLNANHRVIVGAWKVTHRELSECAFRFVRDCRIPNWPKEHSEAIGREVDAIRKEKLAAMRPVRTEHECPVCHGIGVVIVPHPCCVHQGRITGYYDHRARIRRREVVTVSVICTAPKCWAGQRAAQANHAFADERSKPKLLTMEAYLRRVGMAFEPTVALREWELEQAAKSRKVEEEMATSKADRDELDRTRDIYRSLLGNILARQSAWVEREPYRDAAEVDETEAIPA